MSKFTPTPAEVALINQIFAQADTQKLGVITGEAAVKIFSGSKLSPTVLAEIWNIADEDNNGVLTRKGVGIAVRLLGHAQRGEKVSEALITQREQSVSLSMTRLPTVEFYSWTNTHYRGPSACVCSLQHGHPPSEVTTSGSPSTHACG